ncbi:MAG: SNF2-related protein [Leptospiraceae bacterium]|nr:DEAD/DEAH box helicase family protein [Leptospiraceae bacterium]MCK6379864.1 SNF2-related protein [Leptospiraceae bacterium]
MSVSLQLDLDFAYQENETRSGQFAYIASAPEKGIGRVLEFHENTVRLYFPYLDSEEFFKSNEVQFFDYYPSALCETENFENEMKMSLLASKLKLAFAYNKLSSLSNSRTRLLPHQIESTTIVANSFSPRFILADEVGLGKTIEAGLIIKELVFRKGYKKILIVTPSPLCYQWKEEMKSKFNEDFEIIRRKNFLTEGKDNWQNFNKIITSIDFIKNPKYSEDILKKKWEIVVFDEAHRLRRDYSKITRAYIFAEKISKKCECLLLLSATPFRGKLEELYYLLHLVDPNILGTFQSFTNDYVLGAKSDLKDKISKVLLRRRKIEVGGFTKRHAKTVRIELSDEERIFYDETTNYVKREYNIAMNSQNRATGFVMIVFQKLLDSSVHALLNALTKRKFLIESKFHNSLRQHSIDFQDWDFDETENVEELIDSLEDSIPVDFQNIRRELFTLNRLIHIGRSISEDRKVIKLKETIVKLKKEGHHKFIIFTQFRSTQEFLAESLSDFDTILFHGSLSSEEKEKAIYTFKSSSEILISTEAGGEGRNLQFANILFNYDLPWSPLKIEQRIGRIHRFGQKTDVYIFNFASKDTVAERILDVLSNKIRLFEESIGESDALLGTIEDELDFQSNFMQFITGRKTSKEMEEELDNRIQTAKKGFKKLNELLTPKVLDFNLQDYYSHTIDDRSVNNSHLELFMNLFLQYFPEKISGSLQLKEKGVYFLNYNNKKSLSTFDSEIALQNERMDFLAFGHPLVESCIDSILKSKYGYKNICIRGIDSYTKKIIFIYFVKYSFSMTRTEMYYIEFNIKNQEIKILQDIPEIFQNTKIHEPIRIEPKKINIEKHFLQTRNFLESIAENRKQELEEETISIFKKEEYKLEISFKRQLRQLEEKLMRQEANFKWEPKPEKKSSINRTKNEIIRLHENFEKEKRKIRGGKTISYKIDLFQVYIAN